MASAGGEFAWLAGAGAAGCTGGTGFCDPWAEPTLPGPAGPLGGVGERGGTGVGLGTALAVGATVTAAAVTTVADGKGVFVRIGVEVGSGVFVASGVGVQVNVGTGVGVKTAVGVAVAADTLTVPVIPEWSPQWYAKVPAVANMKEYVLPGKTTLGELNAPLSDITECDTLPITQVTCVPTGMVMGEGLNVRVSVALTLTVRSSGAAWVGMGDPPASASSANSNVSARANLVKCRLNPVQEESTNLFVK